MYAWLDKNAADERGPNDTPEQFYYKSRKKALGPFKKDLWKLPPETDDIIRDALQAKFEFLFQRLNVVNTCDIVMQAVQTVELHKEQPIGIVATKAKDDVKGLAD